MLNLIVPEFYRHLRRRYRFPRHNFYLKLFNIAPKSKDNISFDYKIFFCDPETTKIGEAVPPP